MLILKKKKMRRDRKTCLNKLRVLVILLIAMASTAQAQSYTLTDADVEMSGGFITSCSYSFANKDIIIPPVLDGQEVIGVGYNEHLGKRVFANKGITSVIFPEGLTHIGSYAFYQNAITSLNLPSSLTYIGAAAFNNNIITRLNGKPFDGYFYRPNADGSFDHTQVISYAGASKSIVILPHVEIIGKSAFSSLDIEHVDFSKASALKEIGEHAFSHNKINHLDLSKCTALNLIGTYAFYQCQIATFDLSACTALTTINPNAFANNRLTLVDLTANTALEAIEKDAFYSNLITDLSLPNSIIKFGSAPFNKNKIVRFNGAPSNGIIYGRNGDGSIDNTYIVSFGGTVTSIKVPAAVEQIGINAFRSSDLIELDLTACKALESISSYAFSSNTEMTVKGLNDCTALLIVSRSAFASTKLSNVDLSKCKSLLSVGHYAFDCSTITSFTLPQPANAHCTFENWEDSKGGVHNGSPTVTDKSISYSANYKDCYAVSFYIKDKIEYLRDVKVDFGKFSKYGTEYSSTSNGVAHYRLVAKGNDLPYTISKKGFITVNGTVSVVDRNVSEHVTLTSNLSASFRVLDGETPIAKAKVALSNYGSAYTDLNGVATFTQVAPAKNMAYTVTAAGYNVKSGEMTLVDQNVSTDVALNLLFRDVTFTIKSGAIPIENATIGLTGYGTVTTNALGLATFANVAQGNDIAYAVVATNYDNANGVVSVVDQDVNKEVNLNLTTYNVSFNVNLGGDAISNAEVSLTGYGTATTDVTGMVAFTGVAPEVDIAYTVLAEGYDEATGVVTVVDQNVSQAIELMVVTSINDRISSRLTLYPNPVVNTLYIQQEAESRITRVEVYNLTGRLVKTKQIASEQQTLSLDLGGLPASTYILKCFTANDQFIAKQVIKK